MVVHYAGYPCDMDAIVALANKHSLKIIEDCAHAPGTIYQSQAAPGRPEPLVMSAVSVFSNKNMTTGEGGMIVTNDADLAAKSGGPFAWRDHP